MTRRTAVACLAVLLCVGALSAQEPLPDSVAPDPTPPRSLYDPQNDVFGPSVARGLYVVSLLQQGYYWAILPVASFDLGGDATRTLGLGMLTFGGGVAGTFLGTRRYPASLGSTALSYSWGNQGAWTGLLVGDLLYDWGQEGVADFRLPFLTAAAGSFAGNIVGYSYAARHGLNGGNALMLGTASTTGAAYGALLTSLAFDPDEAELFPYERRLPWERKIMELGSLAGQGAGHWLWRHHAPQTWTTGDALSFSQASGLSVGTGLTTLILLGDGLEYRPAMGVSMLVTGAGLVYSYAYHRKRDLSLTQAIYTTLTTALGTAVGGGIAFVILGDDIFESNAGTVLVPIVAGGWAGFHLGPALARAMPGPSLKSEVFQRIHIAADPTTAVMAYAVAKTGAPVRLPLLSVDF